MNARRLTIGLLAVFALSACGGGASQSSNPNTNGGGGTGPSYTGPAPANDDVQAFRIQLWENLRADDRCGTCHDVGGQGLAYFADNSDVNSAYSIANTVVNLTDPAASRMVTIFSGTGHFCWEGSQSACAAQIELWIGNWASDRAGSGGRSIVLSAPNDDDPSPVQTFPDDAPASYAGVHTLLTANCSGCHLPANTTLGPPQSPYFAVADMEESYDTMRTNGLINLFVSTDSRFYERLAEDGHRCWDVAGDGITGPSCPSSATTMLTAIDTFITNGIPAPDMTELNSMVKSKAVSLFEDGISASGGNRYEASQIALYEFKLGSGDTVIDRSGVSPSLNLTLWGEEGVDYEWLGSWGVKFNNSSAKAQGDTSASQKLVDQISTTGEYSIEAWVIPGNVTQEDANIVSYSGGPNDRNFTLGQNMYNYEAYNRNIDPTTDSNGMPLLTTDPDDEDLQATLQHVVVTYDPVNGRRIYVNGTYRDDLDSTPAEGLANWDNSYALVLGNEVSNDRAWEGTLRMVAVHNRALTQDQITQNFDVGVGQKFFLMFDVSEHLGARCVDNSLSDPSLCFIYMEVAQFDNFSFVFNNPVFINLDDTADMSGVRIQGMRIGVNGREALTGQAYKRMDVTIDGSYVAGTGQTLANVGTIVALENGPNPDSNSGLNPDMMFLTFEVLDAATPTKDYSEVNSTTPVPSSAAVVSDAAIRTFEEINASMATITGVDSTTLDIGGDTSRGDGANGTYTDIKQAMPSDSNISGFVPAQQMAITQLAIEYCNALVEDTGTTIPRATYFSGINFTTVNSTGLSFTTAERDAFIDPLLARTMNVDAGATDLTSMPNTADVKQDMNDLITVLSGSCGGTCSPARTIEIMKGTCASIVASAPMLLQ